MEFLNRDSSSLNLQPIIIKQMQQQMDELAVSLEKGQRENINTLAKETLNFLEFSDNLDKLTESVVNSLKEEQLNGTQLLKTMRLIDLKLADLEPDESTTPVAQKIHHLLDKISHFKDTQEQFAHQQLIKQIVVLQQDLINNMRSMASADLAHLELPSWLNENDPSKMKIVELEAHIAALMKLLQNFLSINEEELKKYGEKHANLIRLLQLFEGLRMPGVVVPAPHGVMSEKIEIFLRNQSPMLFEHWNRLGELYAHYDLSTPFLEQPEAKQLLAEIDRGIEKAFQVAGNSETLFSQITDVTFLKWLAEVEKGNDYLMVRSSGAEDSRQSANAGGNVSMAYVPPNPASVSKALGEVVRSYFSYSSLQNRLNAYASEKHQSDQLLNPFEEKLKLAVTVQPLIGEQIGGGNNSQEIPISLVLFTSEPLYVGGEKFRVMRLSATYGHGEGVVGNQGIASDTALVLTSQAHPEKLYILYDIQVKAERLAPLSTAEGIKLVKTANPEGIRNRPALNAELIHRLYTLGVISEKYFDDQPTDMEIVCKNNVIFPVQARPIKRPDLLPTYLDLKKIKALPENPIIAKNQGEMLVPGNGSVVIVKNREEVLYAPTLEEAERMFDLALHKLVIVSKPEPANSHPVVNFSSLGIPCLLIQKGAQIESLLEGINSTNLLAIDVQTATLQLWDARLNEIKDCISEGFAVHPAKIAISLPVSTTLPVRKAGGGAPQEVIDLVLTIQSAVTHEIAIDKLKELREHDWIKEIKAHRLKLEKKLVKVNTIPREAREAHALFKAIENAVDRAIDEAEAVWKNQDGKGQLQPLFHAKVIQNLVLSIPHKTRGLSQYTAVDIKPLYQEIKALIKYQKELSHPAHLSDLFMSGLHAMTAENETSWRDFLRELEAVVDSGVVTPEEILQFKQMVGTLEKTELLPTWFALYFSKCNQPELPIKDRLNSLLVIFPPSEAPFLSHLLELNGALKDQKGHIDQFSHSESFKNGWEWLTAQVEKVNSNNSLQKGTFAECLNHSSPLTQIIAFKIMNELVDAFDCAIKTMKVSPAWSKEDKAHLFKSMLEPYLTMLINWGKNVAEPSSIPMNDHWPLDVYLEKMTECFFKLPDTHPDQLLPSSNFSVTAAMMGSKTVFDRHLPQTLEDIFTLIHQNLLAILSSRCNGIYDEATLNDAFLPEKLKKVLGKINPESFGRKIQRKGLNINDEGVTVTYNIPLRNHSAQLSIQYDKESGEMTCKSFLLGEARNRWENCELMVMILDKLDILKLSDPIYLSEQELNFSWKINSEEDLSKMIDVLNYFYELSMLHSEPFDIKKDCRLIGLTEDKLVEACLAFAKEENLKIVSRVDVRRMLFGLGLNEIIPHLTAAASKGMKSSNEAVRESSFNLFTGLFARKLGHEMAIAAAKSGMLESNLGVRLSSIQLFLKLVQKEDKYLDDFLEFLEKGMQDRNPKVRESIVITVLEGVESGTFDNNEITDEIVNRGRNDADESVREAVISYS